MNAVKLYAGSMVLMLSLAGCASDKMPESLLNSSGSTIPKNPPVTPPPVAALQVSEAFENWFSVTPDKCITDFSTCMGVLGANNGKSLFIRRFNDTCAEDTATSWTGGYTGSHSSPNGNPSSNPNNWQAIRFSVAGHNEALMTREKQKNINGSAQVEFLYEGNTAHQGFIGLMTHVNFSELPGCPGTSSSIYGAGTNNPNHYNAYSLAYAPNWDINGTLKSGFVVFTVDSMSGVIKSKPVVSSFIPYNLDNSWFRLKLSRGTFGLSAKVDRFAAGTWAVVGERTVPIAEASVAGGSELPPGYVGINSDATDLVSFDNLQVNW